MEKRYWAYDEEVYPNFFSIGYEPFDSDEYYYFEISTRRNDIVALQQFVNSLANSVNYFVGFNNKGFDEPILHKLLHCDPWSDNPMAIAYDMCQKIINNRERFNPYQVWDRESVVPQIDLYKLNHYDNNNKRCSLKQLEFAMRMESIVDLPYEPGTMLTDGQMTVTADYMRHDIKATKMFGLKNTWAIDLRHSLSDTYGVNMLNMSDSSIGSKIFEMKLHDAGVETHVFNDVWDEKSQKMKRDKSPITTHRPSISFGEIINDNVFFDTEPFNALLNWLCDKTITKTKDALNDIPYHPELFKYVPPEMIKIPDLVKSDWPNAKIVRNRKTRLSTLLVAGYNPDLSQFKNVTCDRLSITVGGFQFDLGTGGIHGSVSAESFISDEDKVVKDADFASWYPHLSFEYGVYPHHLGFEFCPIYKAMYDERKSYPKSNPVNYALKIALNGSYGNSNSEYSFMYDPKFTMRVTINGQLYLCMLGEQLLKVPGLRIIQVNTDGITMHVPRIYSDHVDDLIKWIETVTRVSMETVTYSRMTVLNVNTYIAESASYEYLRGGEWLHESWFKDNDVKTDGYEGREIIGDYSGKRKRKKAYMLAKDKQWHQDRSYEIVAIAANAALMDGEDIRATIENHTDIFDFMIMVKVPKNSWLKLGGKDIQKTSRVYASNSLEAGQVQEWRKPKKNAKSQERKPNDHYKGVNMKLANDMKDADFDDIDYDFYVAEAEKLVNPLLKR